MSTDDHTPGRRAAARQRRDGRRRRIRTVLWSVVVVVVLLGGTAGALVATGRAPWVTSATDEPNRSVDQEHPPLVDAADPSTRGAQRRALTPDDPLRLWIAGDSLAGSLGPSLGEITAKTGVVAPVYDSRVSSGLANPSFFNWPKHATTELARLRPEAVAFIIGTNDYVIVNGGPFLVPGDNRESVDLRSPRMVDNQAGRTVGRIRLGPVHAEIDDVLIWRVPSTGPDPSDR